MMPGVFKISEPLHRINKHLKKLVKIERRKYHPLVHKLHKKYNISRRTLFYVKEYGPHSHVVKLILKQSLSILLLAAAISAFAGIALESLKQVFISLMPIVILLPVLNDMIGDYGTIVSSRLATMLHQGKIDGHPLRNREVRKLFYQIMIIAMITAIFSTALALIISKISSGDFDIVLAWKVFLIALADTIILVMLLLAIALYAGLYFYGKKEDPNNFLIPITTSIADFGNILVMTFLVRLFF